MTYKGYGAQEGIRTPTTVRSHAPEACASTSSATWALCTHYFKAGDYFKIGESQVSIRHQIMPKNCRQQISRYQTIQGRQIYQDSGSVCKMDLYRQRPGIRSNLNYYKMI